MTHCKKCRKDLEPSAFKQGGKDYKTCNSCRAKRKAKYTSVKKSNKRLTIEECQKVAQERGGLCLSTEYVNNITKMKWRCSEGHEWETCFSNIKNGNRWCLKCSGKEKLTIEDCQEFAKSKGGECLSTKYECKTKMKWRCSEGHEWGAVFKDLKYHNSWCPHCSGKAKHTIEECQKVAQERGGECLSTEYKNSLDRMKWRCKDGHEWMATFNHIKGRNQWCPHCADSRLTIEECQKIAKSKGGECLSTEYKNNRSKMKWRCSKDHEWETSFTHIKNGNQWCPTCSGSRSEELCREILKARTGEDFKKVRPKWLDGLELDGYAKSINMAFEYNGRQHYKYVPYFHRNGIEEFKKQQERDQKKYRICKQRGIQLVLIPYKFNCYNPDELETFIVDQLETLEF